MRNDFANSPNVAAAVGIWPDAGPDVAADSRLLIAQSVNAITMPAMMHRPVVNRGLGFKGRRRSGGSGSGLAMFGRPFGSGVAGEGKWVAIELQSRA